MLGVLAGCSTSTDHAMELSAESFAAGQWRDTIPLSKSVLLEDPSRSMARYYLGLSYLHMFSPGLAKGELELFLADMDSGKEIIMPAAAADNGPAVSRRLLRARAMAGAGAAHVLLGLTETFTDQPNHRQVTEHVRIGRDLCQQAYGLAPADKQVRLIIDRYVAPFVIMNVPRLQDAADQSNDRAASFIRAA
jgi:hypothetical protein